MNIKFLFILLILLVVSNKFIKKDNFADGYMTEASGGLLNKDKSSPFKKNTQGSKDPNSSSFNSDIDTLIKKKSDDRAVIVNEDTKDLKVNKEADVKQIIGGEEEEGNGCNDILLFGLVLLIVIYIVFHQVKQINQLNLLKLK